MKYNIVEHVTGDPVPSPPQVHQDGEAGSSTRRSSVPISGWLMEIGATLISIVGLLIVIGLLARMQDQPLDSWNSRVSLNAMISVLAVVSKAALLVPVASCISQLKWTYFQAPQNLYHLQVFDEASRGGLGAVNFVYRLPVEIAAIGSWVTILAFLIGPFFQQVVDLQPKGVQVVGNQTAAAFGYAHEYMTNITLGEGDAPLAATLDSRMQGAILEGIYGSNLRPAFNCSSNCVWRDSYVTFGFGTECRDVSAETLATKVCQAGADNETVPDTHRQVHNCTMITPGGVSLHTRWVATMIQTLLYVSSKSSIVPNTWWADFENPSDIHIEGYNPEFLTVAQYITESRDWLSDTLGNEKVTECSLGLVAYTYSNVTAVGSEFNLGNRVKHDLPHGRPLNETSDVIVFNLDGLPEFRINKHDWIAASQNIMSQLSEQTVERGDEALVKMGVNVALAQANGDIEELVQRMVERMTDRIATGPNMQVAYGETLQTLIFVHVTWYWLILPILIEMVAIGFLVFTIWKTRPSTGAVLWKSSALGLLYHYTGQSNDPRMTGGYLKCDVDDPKEIERLSEGWVVRSG